MNAIYGTHALFLLHRAEHIAAMQAELAADHGYVPTFEESTHG